MKTRRILATSGGFVPGPVQQSVRLGAMLLDALAMTGKTRPRVCLVYTATVTTRVYYAMSYEAFNAAGCDVTELKLFTQPSADPEERLCGSDLVWVGGGSVANLLALWRLHGVDEAMREAWTRGRDPRRGLRGQPVLAHRGHDRLVRADLVPVTNGLGLVALRQRRALRLRSPARPAPAPTRREQRPAAARLRDRRPRGHLVRGIEATRVVGHGRRSAQRAGRLQAWNWSTARS